MDSISIDSIANKITEAVREYTEEVSIAIEEKVDEVAREVLMETAMNAPGEGRYARGFKITNSDEYGKTKRVIWNKKNYRLVHLLEFGHAFVNHGGRYNGKPHLRPAYEKYGAELPDHIKRIIKNGGGK